MILTLRGTTDHIEKKKKEKKKKERITNKGRTR